MSEPITVLKLGGSVLDTPGSLAAAVHEIVHELRAGHAVVAVVSARRGVTDLLDRQARRLADEPDPHAYAALLASGEASAAAALVLTARGAGLDAELCPPSELGLTTVGDPTDAEPIAADTAGLLRRLRRSALVVASGFVAQDASGRPTLLGRGGSDLTAIFLAHALRAHTCRLVKDVGAWLTRDPKTPPAPDESESAPGRYATLAWDDALAAADPVVQPKAVLLARELGRRFEVGGLGSDAATRVGPEPTTVVDASAELPPLRVGIVGAGAIAGGVALHLLEDPRFELVAAVADDPDPRQSPWLARAQADRTETDLHPDRIDVLVATDDEASDELAERFVASGRTVVATASDAIDQRAAELADRARAAGGWFLPVTVDPAAGRWAAAEVVFAELDEISRRRAFLPQPEAAR